MKVISKIDPYHLKHSSAQWKPNQFVLLSSISFNSLNPFAFAMPLQTIGEVFTKPQAAYQVPVILQAVPTYIALVKIMFRHSPWTYIALVKIMFRHSPCWWLKKKDGVGRGEGNEGLVTHSSGLFVEITFCQKFGENIWTPWEATLQEIWMYELIDQIENLGSFLSPSFSLSCLSPPLCMSFSLFCLL